MTTVTIHRTTCIQTDVSPCLLASFSIVAPHSLRPQTILLQDKGARAYTGAFLQPQSAASYMLQ